jgi:dihydroorotate dehydrogenase (NAD+) catalytic subunit
MLNSIGLQNVGVEAFIKEKVPFLKQFDTCIVANINGETVEEYEELASRLDLVKEVHALEINLSCPNVKAGGVHFGRDPEKVYEVTSRVRKKFGRGIFTKLSPNVNSIIPIAEAVQRAGSDAVSLVNTFLGMAVDIHKKIPVLKSVFGGLSGPAIKPIALRMVYEVYSKVHIPILGMGGIASVEDALEFLIAGASAVSVGTANFYDPRISLKIVNGLREYMTRNDIKDIREIVGSLKVPNS